MLNFYWTLNQYIQKGTFENFLTHCNRYKEFLLFHIEQNLVQCEFENNEEYPLDIKEELIIEEEFFDINFKEIFSKDLIIEKFKFRLITQNRFNSCGLFYPISFLKQYFYKNDEKRYFDEKIRNQIKQIKFFYADRKYFNISEINNILMNSDGQLYVETTENKKLPLLSYCSDKNEYENFNVNNFSEIAIDHVISMNTILNNSKNEFKELKKISNELRKYLKKPITYKKLISKGTKLSDNKIFTNTIDIETLKFEFEAILGKMDLQLMHTSHNNFKRAKD